MSDHITDNGDGTHTIRIDVVVKNAILEDGGIEIFANHFGWVSHFQEEQNGQTVLIENPEPALDFAVARVKDWITATWQGHHAFMKQMAAQQASQSATENMLKG